jgi:hypothetical protein
MPIDPTVELVYRRGAKFFRRSHEKTLADPERLAMPAQLSQAHLEGCYADAFFKGNGRKRAVGGEVSQPKGTREKYIFLAG